MKEPGQRSAIWRVFVGAIAAVALSSTVIADTSPFEKRTYKAGTREAMPYRLFIPRDYDSTKRYPLVLWLHGGGGRGNDNEKQLTGGNSAGARVWAAPASQSRYPAFVVAPQCPEGETWTPRLRQVVELVEELRKAYSIDPQRLYLAGQSMGGYAVWSLLATYPDLFAAAIPICGGGDVSQARKMTQVSIWAFHGELDRAVSVERSREMVAAVKRLGGIVRYTEYKGADHVIWSLAFAEPDLLPWVFAQRRNVPPRVKPGYR
jgi:predicted peptidase